MNALTRLGHLPLLVKELLEQAARPRTYWTRVAYGALLYLIVVGPQARFFQGTPGNAVGVLGAGKDLFEILIVVQFTGIAIFLPALMCGRITQEKERDSLVLLLLTELSPAQIVLQKYFAGLVPMLTFLLLGLPLAAVAYAFGGFPPRDLMLAAVTLLLACLQLGAIALWCSAICRNTATAFVATYVIAGLFYGGPIGLLALAEEYHVKTLIKNFVDISYLFALHIPPAIFEITRENSWKMGSFRLGVGISLATTLLFLLLAVYHLPRRAFAPPARLMKRFFGWLDRGSQRVNHAIGNIVLSRPSHALPADAPVLWRERRSRLMGRPAYLVRLLLAVEIPVLLLVRAVSSTPSADGIDQQIGLSVFAAAFGMFCVLALSVTAANSFAAERVNQTLEVLLTTPLSAQEIVRQKARALRGLIIVCAVPLLTIFGYEALLEYTGTQGPARTEKAPLWVYVSGVLLTVAIYLPLVNWLALWVGLATRTRLRAIAVTLCTIVGWCVLPYIVLMGMLGIYTLGNGSWLLFASPLTVPSFNEINGLHEFGHGPAWLPILVNFTLYGIILHAVRGHCLAHADEYLRR